MRDAMLRAGLVCSALFAVALLVSGCAGGSISEAEQQSLAAAATAPATLQPGDKIRVDVFGEDKLSGEYELDQAGQISVTIGTLAPYYMMGEVKTPGQFAYRSGLNVLTAMAIAGGPTYRANRSTVQIQRRGETNMRDYPISASVPILPGDVIKVPERYF